MITVPEAAKRAGRNPETIRRWIRSGRLKAQRIGTQHIIEEGDLVMLLEDEELPLPPAWSRLADGRQAPNVVRAIRLSRLGR
jgi:excisionase family DNA binding protein